MKEKIIFILKGKKWKQIRLAKELGVSPTRLNQWYKGHTEPKELWLIEKVDKLYNECLTLRKKVDNLN